MSGVRYWSHLAACMVVAGCGPGATPGTDGRPTGRERPITPTPTVLVLGTKFYCEQYPGQRHYVSRCAVTFRLDTTRAGEWTRLGCFGELKFAVVDNEGRVRNHPKGFYEGASQREEDHIRYPAEFDLTSFTYFPEDYGALDPSLDWYKCEVHE